MLPFEIERFLKMIMNCELLKKQSQRLHATAKNGVMIHNKERYEFKFDRYYGVYSVINSHGEVVVRFNTRLIKTAKKWLKEYLDN